jgi:hypothetical protein
MALTANTADRLGSVTDGGFTSSWDWKSNYVSKLAEDGYERFSSYSATPDSTIMFGGPARFTALDASNPSALIPIGMADNIQFGSNAQLARLYEIGSNRAFFTRGKTISQIGFSRMLADQQNILNVLTSAAYRPAAMNIATDSAASSGTNPNVMMNLDSEYFSVPFGILLVFKTRNGGDSNGKVLSAMYLEYAMFSNFGFQIAASSPVIMENISIEFDRVVPVSFS